MPGRRPQLNADEVLQALGDALCVLDPDYKFLYVNPAAERLFDSRSESLLDKSLWEVFPALAGTAAEREYRRAMTERKISSFENYAAPLDKWYDVRISPLSGGRLAVQYRDITRRKEVQAEHRRLGRELRHRVEELETVMEIAPVAIWVGHDAECRVVTGNRMANLFYEVVEGENVSPTTDPRRTFYRGGEKLQPSELPMQLAAVQGNELRDCELDVVLPGGNIRRMLGNASPLRNAAGQVRGCVGAFLDLTERIDAEQKLRASEKRYRGLFESMQEGFLIGEVLCDEAGNPVDWRYVDFNPAFEAMVRRTRDQLVGRTFREVFPDVPHDEWVRCLGKVALTGEPACVQLRQERASRCFEAVAYRPQPGQFAATVNDVTERRRSEERLRQTQKLESIGLLAGGIAHDFNNLLTGIMGNISMVLDQVGPGPAAHMRDAISGASRAANLTRQLLAYAGKGSFVVRDIDVSQVLHEISDLAQFSIPRSVEFAVSVQKPLPPVRIDPSQFHQIIMNLVINAGEALGEGISGKISISAHAARIDKPFLDAIGQEAPAGRYVCLEVSDTGTGMDEATRASVFEPFFTTKFTGRGLGLAAVAGIVRSQQGAITVDSAPGAGSVFRVFLPAANTQHQEENSLQPAGGRGAILVVDDEPSVRGFIASVLCRKGYRILTASDGREALAICDRENVPLQAAVVDVVMPVMGANDLLPALAERRPEARILLTSGYTESEARRLCSASPGAGFIQKPYTAQQIAAAVEDLLDA